MTRRPSTPALVQTLLMVGVVCGCATTVVRGDRTRVVVADESGDAIYNGAASFVLRHPEHVVTLKGVGEVQLGVDGDPARCRLVRALPDSTIAIQDGNRCPRVERDAACFDDTRFASADGTRALTVSGCAYENDLKWSKLQGSREASVGPGAWRRRCVPIESPALRCPPTFLHLDDIAVQENVTARAQFSFAHDGDRFSACFLERESGPYRIVLRVEDECGARAFVTLAGDSTTLDD